MDFVTIQHPHPEVGDAQVPESAVDVWRRSGWLTEEEYAAQQAAQKEAAGQPQDSAPKDDAAKTTSKPAGRSRRSTEES